MTSAPHTGVSKILSSFQTSTSQSPQRREVFSLFSLAGRVAIVTGAARGIGLEIACAFAEAGAVVYCLDAQGAVPPEDFVRVAGWVEGLVADEVPAPLGDGMVGGHDKVAPSTPAHRLQKKGRLVYVHADVRDQMAVWDRVERIAEVEGRVDVCVANAGVLRAYDAMDYPEEDWKQIMDINVNGVLYTAQAAARQMKRLGISGSIILTASMSGSITNKGEPWAAYNTSKAAVVQMARSLACEWGPCGIRVNSVSPGYINSQMTKQFLETKPGLKERWEGQNPLGRIGETQELRGVYLWLASDASTFCTGGE